MRYGARAYGLEDIGRIASLNLSFVEINILEASGSFILNPSALLEELGRWGVFCLVHGPNEGDPCDLHHLGDVFAQQIFQLIDVCQQISVPVFTMHFWLDGRFIPDAILKRKRDILCKVAGEAIGRGVRICVENLSERAEDLEPVLDSCPDLGITLDIGHGQLLTRRNRALEIIKRWPERIRHVHAHDNLGGKTVQDDLHLPIGDGVINFAEIFENLVRRGYGNTVTLEVPMESLASSEERLQKIVEQAASTGSGSSIPVEEAQEGKKPAPRKTIRPKKRL